MCVVLKKVFFYKKTCENFEVFLKGLYRASKNRHGAQKCHQNNSVLLLIQGQISHSGGSIEIRFYTPPIFQVCTAIVGIHRARECVV